MSISTNWFHLTKCGICVKDQFSTVLTVVLTQKVEQNNNKAR